MPHIDRRAFALGSAGALAAAVGTPASTIPAFAATPRTVTFADGAKVSALGQGSWHAADGRATPEAVADALKLGISLGLTLVDTSDNYGAGRAEAIVAKAIAGQRETVFLVSKLDPEEAMSNDGVERALRASLKRLGTDHLDLYLLHQRRGADIKAAVKGLERVRAQGLTKRWGVSNFSVADMEAVFAADGGTNCATNQVLYNLAARGIETGLVPWCATHRMPIMAYSPLGSGGRGGLLSNPALKTVADARGVAPAAIALAWAMRDGRTIALMESGSAAHVREDAAAAALELSAAEIKALDAAFPPPRAG